MRSFRLRRAAFIRNFIGLSAFMAVAYAAFGLWPEAGATVISASIGIPLAWVYLRWRTPGAQQSA
jgi:ABC-type Fe3+ transport system permease subunit